MARNIKTLSKDAFFIIAKLLPPKWEYRLNNNYYICDADGIYPGPGNRSNCCLCSEKFQNGNIVIWEQKPEPKELPAWCYHCFPQKELKIVKLSYPSLRWNRSYSLRGNELIPKYKVFEGYTIR